LICKPQIEDPVLAELSLVEVSYTSNSLSIKEATIMRSMSSSSGPIIKTEKIKIYDICQYIDARNWKCGPFQMQEATLVKNEKIRYSLEKKIHGVDAQTKLCQKEKSNLVSAVIKIKPEPKSSTINLNEVKIVASQKEAIGLTEPLSTSENIVKSSLEIPAADTPQSIKAMNTFLGKLAGQIRSNVNFSSSGDEKWEVEVEVALTEEGRIGGHQLVKTSGNSGWDAAVMRAVSMTILPESKIEFKMPKMIVLAFSNR